MRCRLTYHAGPGPATVHLKVDFDWTNKPLHDVIATIPGAFNRERPVDRFTAIITTRG